MNFELPIQNDRIHDNMPLLDRYFVMHILFIHIPITIGDMISDGFQVSYNNYLILCIKKINPLPLVCIEYFCLGL